MDKKVETMQYSILKSDHKKVVDILSKALKYQKDNPSLIRYSISRTWFREDPDNPDQEILMFMDEAKSHEAYAASMISAQSDPQLASFTQQFKELIIPGSSPLKHTVWEEVPELHAELNEDDD